MKKLKSVLLATMALMATGAQAQWQPNWLLGISGSYNWIKLDHDDNTDGFLINGTTETDFNVGGSNNNSWGWGIFGGYQARCNSWLLGAELAVDWIDAHHHNNNNFAFTSILPAGRAWLGSASFDRDYVLALTGRLGYEITPYFMAYARAGVETGRDKVSFLVSTADGATPILTAAGDSRRQSWRFIGGIGAEMPLTVVAGLTARAEWNFHSDGRSVDATALANDNATLISVGGKQESNTAKVSLVYNFPA